MTKRIDFKLKNHISIMSALSSGFVGIAVAYVGYGLWSLVFKTISMKAINSALLWLWNKWRPIKNQSVKLMVLSVQLKKCMKYNHMIGLF